MDVQKFDNFSTTIIFEIGRKLINLTTTWRATCTAINAYVTIQISLILYAIAFVYLSHTSGAHRRPVSPTYELEDFICDIKAFMNTNFI